MCRELTSCYSAFALSPPAADDEFLSLQRSYLDAHCHEFDDSDENKLSYTPIFERYVERMEGFISEFLSRRMPGFDMEAFLTEIEARGESELCGDVFDVLASMSDFEPFKQLMLAHKHAQSNEWSVMRNSAPPTPSSAAAAASSSSGSSGAAAK